MDVTRRFFRLLFVAALVAALAVGAGMSLPGGGAATDPATGVTAAGSLSGGKVPSPPQPNV